MSQFKNILSYDSLDSGARQLIDEAIRVRQHAYTPYSHFKVGAALRTAARSDDSTTGGGRVYAGCNVENASYGVAICAERVAIVKAVSDGDRDLRDIAVVADYEGSSSFVTPCGACRQFVAEFSRGHDVRVFLTGTKKESVAVTSIRELLPFGFDF